MFEDGYGGNGLRLISLLEDLKSEEIDYFKFCLLDYDKEALRENLIREY